MQLTLFESPPLSQQEFENYVRDTRSELTNVRRGLFRRYGELEEQISALKQEIAALRDILGLKQENYGEFKLS